MPQMDDLALKLLLKTLKLFRKKTTKFQQDVKSVETISFSIICPTQTDIFNKAKNDCLE